MDIHKGLGNANKLMNRILYDGMEKFDLRIHELIGGSLRNAIPRESKATVVIDTISKEPFFFEMNELINDIKAEYKSLEPNLSITITEAETPSNSNGIWSTRRTYKIYHAALNGVYRMSPDIDGLVETSNNIAKVIVKDGNIQINCLTRSSSETIKQT